MVCLIRVILGIIIGILICVFGIIFCLFSPRNPKNVAKFAHIFGRLMAPLFGIKVITRKYSGIDQIKSSVFIANHQNNYDLLVAGQIVQSGTVTVGKKSLVWVPFFGPLYWLTGNILLDRDNKSKARDTLAFVVNEIKQKSLSVWMFPEGTRSRGRGLLPFKTGAFRTAIAANVPIVPICVSNTNNIKLNRWNNGYMIVEMLEPIDTSGMKKEDIKDLMDRCYLFISNKTKQLDDEVAQLNSKE
ncbi:1-acyl-sn-glycerol-3-phosphate acyltransferase [Orbus hercynius]|uniref:1-acyl-sn-glycerol-3-phosphate acyltransferase n=1 Tax=Orbus hercynius TaxID=593135 RepID=A0A495RCK7_9GAMM|nr:1-acylglycerol-3-phosphate O-acyltransferase [Orbus hercynius]RKS85081.1 1-acyl-sn-glycerol-3-phosphate acyltransferase [Orbus hercynius]